MIRGNAIKNAIVDLRRANLWSVSCPLRAGTRRSRATTSAIPLLLLCRRPGHCRRHPFQSPRVVNGSPPRLQCPASLLPEDGHHRARFFNTYVFSAKVILSKQNPRLKTRSASTGLHLYLTQSCAISSSFYGCLGPVGASPEAGLKMPASSCRPPR